MMFKIHPLPMQEENNHPEEKPDAGGDVDVKDSERNGDAETAGEEMDAKKEPAPMEDQPSEVSANKEGADGEEKQGDAAEETEEDEDTEPPGDFSPF